MKTTQLKEIIAKQFSGQKNVIAVLLYGSQAKGLAKAESDVDIAVLYRQGYAPDTLSFWELKEILEEKLGKDVDLICLNTSNTIISSQIYKYHQPILINDQKTLDRYFMFLISDYAELKELRRPMEEHILERKYDGS
jgi:predicted nucleotidyltransferase